MIRFLLLLAFTAAFSPLSGFQSDPSGVFRSRYYARTWGAADGLATSKINAVLYARDGFVYVASQRGLYRFDGLRFHLIKSQAYPQLEKAAILDLSEEPAGVIWAGTLEAGIVRVQGDSVRIFSKENAGLPINLQKPVVVDAAGTVWAGAYHGGLSKIEKDTVTAIYGINEGLADDGIWTMFPDAPGKLWIGTNGGLFRFENGRFTKSGAALGLNNQIIRALYQDADSSLWVGTDGGGLTQLRNGQAELFVNSTVGLQNDFILGIQRNREALWLGTYGAGLIAFTGNNAIPFSKVSGLSNNFVFGISLGPDGSVWAATDDGLNALFPRSVQWVSTADGLAEEQLFGIFYDSKHRIWLSPNGGGAQVLDFGKPMQTIAEKEGLPLRFLYCFEEDRAGNIWIGTQGGGLYRLNRGTVDLTLNRFPDRFVRALATDSSGGLWIGTGKGLFYLEAPESETPEPVLVSDSLFVSTITILKNGDAAVGTYGQGLLMFSPGRTFIKQLWSTNSIVPDRLFTMYEDVKSRLWIGSRSSGAVVMTADTMVALGEAQGFPESVPAIIEDREKRIWMGISARGLLGYDQADIDALLEGTVSAIEPYVFNESDGLPTLNANAGFTGQVVRDSSGTLWFSTMKGLVGFTPELEGNNRQLASLVAMKLDGELIKPQKNLLLPFDFRNLEIEFGTTNLISPEKTRFKYRLSGLSESWTDAGTSQIALFPSLPSGDFSFEVAVTDRYGRWSEPSVLFSAHVDPPLWQRAWFLAAVLAILILPVVWIVRLISYRKLRAANRALELERSIQKERERISRDLHDSVGSSVTNLITGLEIAKELTKRGEIEKTASMLNTLDADAREAMHELRETIWLLDRERLPLTELNRHVRMWLQKIRPYLGQMQVEFEDTDTAEAGLPSVAALHTLRIIQECLNNARKYSSATLFTIGWKVAADRFELSCTDNGAGFDLDNAKDAGNGLKNMRFRAEQMNAAIHMKTAAGAGTSVQLTIPL